MSGVGTAGSPRRTARWGGAGRALARRSGGMTAEFGPGCEDVTVNEIFAGSVLAEQEHSAGGLGLLIVVGLIVVSTGLFFMLSRSLRRMRANVANGDFLGVESDRLSGPVDPRQAIRRRSVLAGRRGPVIDGEVVGDAAATGGAGEHLDLPVQPGPPSSGG